MISIFSSYRFVLFSADLRRIFHIEGGKNFESIYHNLFVFILECLSFLQA